MDFCLPENLLQLRDSVRSFALEVVAPAAKANDLAHEYPVAIIQEAGRRGLMGPTIPAEYGGIGVGNLGASLITEEISRVCASTAVTLSVHNSLLSTPLLKFGSEEIKRRYLPLLATGEMVGAYALTEAEAGSDAANQQTKADLDGDHYVLNGTKLWITTGDYADLFIVFARTSMDDEKRKARGVTAFVVEKSFGGILPGKKEEKCGIRASSTTEVVLENCRVPIGNVLGEVGKGFSIAMDTLDGGRIGIGSQALGIGQACLDASVKFATETMRGGRPLAASQAIQWRIADMATKVEAARLLVRQAAWLRDRGEPCSQQASMAKLHASTMANDAARKAVEIHGSAGCSSDFPVERFLRDARITEIYEGTTEIQHMVIARSLLRPGP